MERTLYQNMVLTQLVETVGQNQADIVVQEGRCTGSGIIHKSRYNIYTCSCNAKHHMFGLGFVVYGTIKQRVMGFASISYWMSVIRIR